MNRIYDITILANLQHKKWQIELRIEHGLAMIIVLYLLFFRFILEKSVLW